MGAIEGTVSWASLDERLGAGAGVTTEVGMEDLIDLVAEAAVIDGFSTNLVTFAAGLWLDLAVAGAGALIDFDLAATFTEAALALFLGKAVFVAAPT
ncbi:MAG TPA: hypothetical protein VN617_02870 [Rhodoferax sp.]|nr:hypothetical protein [Rhodoferax sp.]